MLPAILYIASLAALCRDKIVPLNLILDDINHCSGIRTMCEWSRSIMVHEAKFEDH
jgi:hypothetical protein